MDHQQFIVYYGEVVAKNWSSLLIEVTISRSLFVVMPENGIFCEFNFSNGILWEFSQKQFSNFLFSSHSVLGACLALDENHPRIVIAFKKYRSLLC